MCVCVCVSIWYVSICVCIDLRLGWEPCSVPAWLINGVVMAIGRNEGTKRRRPASLDAYTPLGTHTVSRAHRNSLSMLYTFLTNMLVTHSTLSGCFYCTVLHVLVLVGFFSSPSFLSSFSFFVFMCCCYCFIF